MGDTSFIQSTLIEYFTENRVSFINFDSRKITEQRKKLYGANFAVVKLGLSIEGVASSVNLSATELIIAEPYQLAYWGDGSGGQLCSGSLILKNSNGDEVFKSIFNDSAELKNLLKDVFPDKASLKDKRELEYIKKEINNCTVDRINDYVWDLQANIRLVWKHIEKNISDKIKFKSLIIEILSTSFTNVYKQIIRRIPSITENATEDENNIPKEEKAVPILITEIESILVRLRKIEENVSGEEEKRKLSVICSELQKLREISD